MKEQRKPLNKLVFQYLSAKGPGGLKGWWMIYAVAILAVSAFTLLPDLPRFYFLGVERDIFVIAISAAVLMGAWFLYYNFPKMFIVWFIWAGLIQNLLDELLFNPYEYQWNEYVTIAISVMIYLNGLKNKTDGGS